MIPPIDRRRFLNQTGGGFGGLALAHLLSSDSKASLLDGRLHHAPKAKRVIGGSLTISIGVGIIVAAVLGVLARPLMAAMLGASAAANPAMWTAASQYTTIRALG